MLPGDARPSGRIRNPFGGRHSIESRWLTGAGRWVANASREGGMVRRPLGRQPSFRQRRSWRLGQHGLQTLSDERGLSQRRGTTVVWREVTFMRRFYSLILVMPFVLLTLIASKAGPATAAPEQPVAAAIAPVSAHSTGVRQRTCVFLVDKPRGSR